VLEGDDTAVEAMIAAMHEGPPRARVDSIECEAVEAMGFTSFERR
jgi:acylphosphatase